MQGMQEAYEETRAYFALPGAVLGKDEARSGNCVYVGLNGERCAVGCRMSDAWIAARGGAERVNEAGSVEGLFDSFDADTVAPIVGDHGSELFYFNRDMQQLHDSESQDALDFVRKLDLLAARTGLTVARDARETALTYLKGTLEGKQAEALEILGVEL